MKHWQIILIICNNKAYSRKKGHACSKTKKGQESPVKEHTCGFFPLVFSNLGHLESYTP